MENKNQIKYNCELSLIEDYLTQSELDKIKSFVSKQSILKQIYCVYWLRGICIFPSHICYHAHGCHDLEYIPPLERKESTILYQINPKSLIFENSKERKIPLYPYMTIFEEEVIKEKLYEISENSPKYTQEEMDSNFEIRHIIRDIYQMKIGVEFLRMLYVFSRKKKYFLTLKFVETEFRRVKLNKMNTKPSRIHGFEFILINIVLPPYLEQPTCIIIEKKDKILYDSISVEAGKKFITLQAKDDEQTIQKKIREFQDLVKVDKTVLCDQWLRGFCIFERENCKKAHGIDDLDQKVFKEFLKRAQSYNTHKSEAYEDKEKKSIGKVIILKIEKRRYIFYEELQRKLVQRGVLQPHECIPLEKIHTNQEYKMFLRKLFYKEEGYSLLNELFKLAQRNHLPKRLIDGFFKEIAFDCQSSIFNNEEFYEAYEYTTTNERKKLKIPTVVKRNLSELEELFEKRIVEIMRDLQKIEKNISLSLITKEYYKKSENLDPTIRHFLGLKNLNLLEYIEDLERKGVLNLKGLISIENEIKLKKTMVFNVVNKFWKEKKDKKGLSKKKTLKRFVEDNLKEIGPLKNNEFDKFLFEFGYPCIQLHFDSFVLNASLLLQNTNHDKTNKKKNHLTCKSLLNSNKLKNIESFQNNITLKVDNINVIDSLESYYNYASYLANFNEFGVDLEGKLCENGRIDLIQISVLSNKEPKIFIFDIYVLQNEDFYEEVQQFIKDLFENQQKIKIFFDCRRDSYILHEFMDIHCNNVIDLAGMQVLIDQLSFSQENKLKLEFNQYQTELLKKKHPGLNDILSLYDAKHGINEYKSEMKEKFGNEDWEDYFSLRPIPEKFKIYAARDVEDLGEILPRMFDKLKTILEALVGKEIDKKIVFELVTRISNKYVKEGCIIEKEEV